MPSRGTEILLFTTEEDIVNMRRATALAAGLTKAGWSARVVNRLSSDLEELRLAAKHRAIHIPRWLVLHNGRTWRDELVMPTYNEAAKLLAKLEK